ncbi:MAG: FHA domain-containing protein [Phototrophicaceae bacterium]
MATLETLFEQYTELRLNGKEQEVVFQLMRDAVINNLTRTERNTLAIQCKQWEKDRTHPNLTHVQREALRRAALTNITLKITFCPACDTPNADGFTRCQVCDEPLAVAHEQKKTTTSIKKENKGSIFERDSILVLKLTASNDRLNLQPQMSATGLKIGRSSKGVPTDVDLNPLGGGDYGVSRFHAILRYDKAHHRLVIIDNNSTNGTFINGVQLPPHAETTLSDGATLKFARMQFIVQFK